MKSGESYYYYYYLTYSYDHHQFLTLNTLKA